MIDIIKKKFTKKNNLPIVDESDFFYSLSSSKYYFIQFYFSKNEGGGEKESYFFCTSWSISLEYLRSARFTGKGRRRRGTLIREGRDGKQWWLSRNVYSLIMWTRDPSSEWSNNAITRNNVRLFIVCPCLSSRARAGS